MLITSREFRCVMAGDSLSFAPPILFTARDQPFPFSSTDRLQTLKSLLVDLGGRFKD